VKDVEYKTICESGTLINCYPILNLNEDGVWLKFDSYKTIEGYNKEQQELLDEVYENYESRQINMYIPIWSQEEFINKCKTDTEFSEKWGLKIEERELSDKERVDIFNTKMKNEGLRTQIAIVGVDENYWKSSLEKTEHNIPTKLITITYNDTKLESYE
jgi:hypothetical protein